MWDIDNSKQVNWCELAKYLVYMGVPHEGEMDRARPQAKNQIRQMSVPNKANNFKKQDYIVVDDLVQWYTSNYLWASQNSDYISKRF